MRSFLYIGYMHKQSISDLPFTNNNRLLFFSTSTLRADFQDIWIDDYLGQILGRPVALFGFTPQVRSAVHAGNVEDSDAFQREVTEVQRNAAALRRTQVVHK